MPDTTLPDGPRGQALAAALTALAILLLLVLLMPLHGLYMRRADALTAQQALLTHTQALIARIPAENARYRRLRSAATDTTITLPGASDAEAAAALTRTIQTLARNHAIDLTSEEPLTTRTAGHLRAIAVRIALSAPWPAMTALLQDIAQATPRLLVDDLSIQRTTAIGRTGGARRTVDCTLTVIGFRPDLDPSTRSAARP